ncbi:MAG: sodium-dependent transporter [Synergistaceae bacterium]|jgi:NSS family neurotransmitter:Na+ symporter|nr:sodium-dependent transporter [Synergistaceae bacterium]
MAEIKQNTEQFASRWGLLCTVLGMAVGTGNIWRFPREVASLNGGAFIIATLIAIIIWAVPLITAESVFGKKTRMANAGAFKVLHGDKWTWMGAFCGAVCIMIGAYYGVVLGWVMRYLYLIGTGFLSQIAALSNADGVAFTTQAWNNFAMTATQAENPVPAWGAVFWFWAAAIIAGLIIWRGVQGGVERANKIMIPAVFILLIILVVRVAMLPGAAAGFEYMFHIDWADFAKPEIWLHAFTQAAWSTGAGWGMFHVFFIYSAKDEDIQLNSFTVAFGDTSAAMLAAMVVLPAVYALSPDVETANNIMKSGSNGLTFINLTNLFAHTAGGTILAVFFFLALFSAALSSLIAMVELGCRNLMDMGFTRAKGTLYTTLFFIVAGSFSAANNNIFENQDMVWGVGLLIVGLCYWFGVVKYGVNKLWDEDINPCSDIHVKWMWSCIHLFPVLFIAIFTWWMWQASTWYPGEWLRFWPITKYVYTPGVMIFEWAILFAILIALNNAMAKRLTHANKVD